MTIILIRNSRRWSKCGSGMWLPSSKEKSINNTMATMSPNSFVNHVPVMTGNVGFSEVRHFYNNYFIPHHTSFVPVARTVKQDRIVDELIHFPDLFR